MDLAGKVALLTGGARIGQTVAQALAQRGWGLALTHRKSRDAAEATAAAARAAGVRTVVLRADVTDEAQVAAAVHEAEQALGRFDILVNLPSTYERAQLESAGALAFSEDSVRYQTRSLRAGRFQSLGVEPAAAVGTLPADRRVSSSAAKAVPRRGHSRR
jgi:NAD(P)-dependent dehydrogenase (short-subunit alcohol dehydrogenase family)